MGVRQSGGLSWPTMSRMVQMMFYLLAISHSHERWLTEIDVFFFMVSLLQNADSSVRYVKDPEGVQVVLSNFQDQVSYFSFLFGLLLSNNIPQCIGKPEENDDIPSGNLLHSCGLNHHVIAG